MCNHVIEKFLPGLVFLQRLFQGQQAYPTRAQEPRKFARACSHSGHCQDPIRSILANPSLSKSTERTDTELIRMRDFQGCAIGTTWLNEKGSFWLLKLRDERELSVQHSKMSPGASRFQSSGQPCLPSQDLGRGATTNILVTHQ